MRLAGFPMVYKQDSYHENKNFVSGMQLEVMLRTAIILLILDTMLAIETVGEFRTVRYNNKQLHASFQSHLHARIARGR